VTTAGKLLTLRGGLIATDLHLERDTSGATVSAVDVGVAVSEYHVTLIEKSTRHVSSADERAVEASRSASTANNNTVVSTNINVDTGRTENIAGSEVVWSHGSLAAQKQYGKS
jgi:hypothetical protein